MKQNQFYSTMCNAMLFLIKVGADWQSVLIIDWPYGYAKGKKLF